MEPAMTITSYQPKKGSSISRRWLRNNSTNSAELTPSCREATRLWASWIIEGALAGRESILWPLASRRIIRARGTRRMMSICSWVTSIIAIIGSVDCKEAISRLPQVAIKRSTKIYAAACLLSTKKMKTKMLQFNLSYRPLKSRKSESTGIKPHRASP